MTVITQEIARQLVDEQGLDVVIPDIYTSIGPYAFRSKQLTSIDIPDSITSIAECAFQFNKLKSVIIPDSVISIGDYAFSGNELTNAVIPDSITSISWGLFYRNQLTSVVIPDSITNIGVNAFSNNQLTSVAIPNSVSTIDFGAFRENQLTSVVIPNSVTKIDGSVFENNHLESVIIPDSITTIYGMAFKSNRLTNLVIPENVTEIWNEAFADNPLLKEIRIYAGLPSESLRYLPSDIKIIAYGGKIKPTDIFISSTTINENIAQNSTIATLNSIDAEISDTHTYQLVSGDGDTDNDAFIIDGDQIKIVESPDFEDKNYYSIRVQTKDTGGLTYEKVLNFAINDLNEVPLDLSVSESTFNENISRGSTVATLSTFDLDSKDTHLYRFAGSGGENDNYAFVIDGDQLKINRDIDFETKSSYSIRLQTMDSGDLYFLKSFTFNVKDLNEVPEDLSVSATEFDENISDGSTVLRLSTSDQDAGDTHTYSLVSGSGDSDNSAFIIDGNKLIINESPDHETQDSYSVRLQSKDSGGLTLEKSFTLTVNNLNESPSAIQISDTHFDEHIVGIQGQYMVATLDAIDDDKDEEYSYSLVDGNGGVDNQYFSMGYYYNSASNSTSKHGIFLRKHSPDYEKKKSYSIRIQATDSQGLSYEKNFKLKVNDLDEGDGLVLTKSQLGDLDWKSATDVVIPDTYSIIDREVFYYIDDQLTSVQIPNSVVSIGYHAFRDNQLTDIVIPDSVRYIGNEAFSINPLKTVSIARDASFDLSVFPEGVKIIRRKPAPVLTEEDGIKQIEYIDDITAQDEISNFEITEPISVGNQIIETIIVGTKKKDKITGTPTNEVLAGGEGKDVLKGGRGADGFLFNTPNGFGKKQTDQIRDFDSDEGDSILVDKDVFGLGKKIKLKVVTGKKASKKAATSKNDFIYDDKKGLLYFNENGKDKGWGDGGLFVKLQGAPELGASDFTIV